MKVCVLGDPMIDEYIHGVVSKLSPEAPIPVVAKERVERRDGGALNLYRNLQSLGVDVSWLDLGQRGISVKTRVIADGLCVARIDDNKYADCEIALKIVEDTDFSQFDYVILSDYNKGSLAHSRKMIEHINKFGCKVIVDPKSDPWAYYGAWLVKPNENEFWSLNYRDWQGNILRTRGRLSVVGTIEGQTIDVPVDDVPVHDVTGAGDCFLAGFVYGLTKKYDYKKCVELGVRAGTAAVQNQGTYVVSKKDVERVVFTNGCFDVLHPGHVIMLQQAKALGTKLIVGINDDESVRRIKGDPRPVNPLSARIDNLRRLGIADEIIPFSEDTPLELIENLKVDVIAKGGDYTPDQVVGGELAEVVILPLVEGFSTTEIIRSTNAAAIR